MNNFRQRISRFGQKYLLNPKFTTTFALSGLAAGVFMYSYSYSGKNFHILSPNLANSLAAFPVIHSEG